MESEHCGKTCVALLRAVNVGGTGRLPMAQLKQMCERTGFADVRTWIASGNVIFSSEESVDSVGDLLERMLAEYAGKKLRVFVRKPSELSAVLKRNPFSSVPGNCVLVLFLQSPPTAEILAGVTGLDTETIELGVCELFIHYPNGIGNSRLKIPVMEEGTARNINTIRRLVELAAPR